MRQRPDIDGARPDEPAFERLLARMGDDVFGRRLTISFLRPQMAEEVARDARYGGSIDRLSVAA